MSNSYTIPVGLRVYAIGDIHGCLDQLKALHEEISMDIVRDHPDHVHMVYLGDYVDRGPDSKGVIDYLIERKNRGDGIRKTFIHGNHERGLLDFIDDPDGSNGSIWMQWGGGATLKSYGIEFDGDIPLPGEIECAQTELYKIMPDSHLEFLNALSSHVEIGEYFFTHAGIDPFKALDKQNEQEMMIMREPFLSWHKNVKYHRLAKRIVHGHTICDEPEVLTHRVGLDTGAWKGCKLTAGVFEGSDVRFIQV